jgi:hypothetical protein
VNTISLKLPKALLQRVTEEARERRTSKSKVIRDCLEQVLCEPKSGKDISCYDLARHLAGFLGGPPDIATNPKYLEDFGT